MRLDAENDGYNALVLGAGLEWRDVSLVRAISRYLRQVRVPFSQVYVTTLTRHGDIARQIITLFKARFDPDAYADMAARDVTQASISADIEAALKSVESLNEKTAFCAAL